MNCINKTTLQLFIDNECSTTERSKIKQHLTICESCLKKYDEQLQLSITIKKSITGISAQNIKVPAFQKPHAKKRFNIKSEIIYSISAACIIVFILMFVDNNQNKNQYDSIISNAYEFDSNQPVTKQDLVINYVDADGNRSEIYIQ